MTNELDKIEAALAAAVFFMKERDVLRDTRAGCEEALTALEILRETHITIARDDVPEGLLDSLKTSIFVQNGCKPIIEAAALIQKEMDK